MLDFSFLHGIDNKMKMRDIVTENLSEAFRSESYRSTGAKQQLVTELLGEIKSELSHGEFRACLMHADWTEVLEEFETFKKLATDRIEKLENAARG